MNLTLLRSILFFQVLAPASLTSHSFIESIFKPSLSVLHWTYSWLPLVLQNGFGRAFIAFYSSNLVLFLIFRNPVIFPGRGEILQTIIYNNFCKQILLCTLFPFNYLFLMKLDKLFNTFSLDHSCNGNKIL